jgi:hypothetical protein
LALTSRRLSLLAFALLVPIGLTGCKVVSLAEDQRVETKAFGAKAYAGGVWTVLPHFAEAAKPQVEMLSCCRFDGQVPRLT